MKTQDEIMRQQNSQDMLRCQYSARFYYNRAERLFWIGICLASVNVLFAFFPEFEKPLLNNCARIAPAAINAFVVVLYIFMNRNIGYAANLRNYFDDKVLGLSISSENIHETTIQTLIYKAVNHNEYKAIISMRNTEKDNPPGVKNWYTFAELYPDDEAVFRCQKQNIDWTYELSTKRILLLASCFVCVIIIGVIMYIVFHADLVRLLICLFSAFAFLLERIVEEKRYYSQTMKIRHNCEICEKTRTTDQINQLQCSIAELRCIPVIGINMIHKRNATALSTKLETVSKRIK